MKIIFTTDGDRNQLGFEARYKIVRYTKTRHESKDIWKFSRYTLFGFWSACSPDCPSYVQIFVFEEYRSESVEMKKEDPAFKKILYKISYPRNAVVRISISLFARFLNICSHRSSWRYRSKLVTNELHHPTYVTQIQYSQQNYIKRSIRYLY